MEHTGSSAALPPHKGLLRDETIFLRHLFGYCDGTHSLRDVKLLAVDIDALQEHERVIQQFHIGVSILDMQALVTNPNLATQIIESHHFVVGDSKFRRTESGKFLFGQSEPVSLSELKEKLEGLTFNRTIALVCHGGDRELKVFQKLDINLYPSFIIDTVKAAQYPLQLYYRYSLEKLLDEFGIPFGNLHVAGNDAHFVLRALLMIVVNDAECQLGPSALPSWVPACKEIAQLPLTAEQLKMRVPRKARSGIHQRPDEVKEELGLQKDAA